MVNNIENSSSGIYNKEINPIKEMLAGFKKIILNEIRENPKLNEAEDLNLIVRNPAPQKDGVVHLRKIPKKELDLLFDKVDKFVNNNAELLPREIEALQQIINAIERKELVIQQGNQYVNGKNSSVFDDLIKKTTHIETAENLAKQKILGRDNGKLVLRDEQERHLLEGVYDVLEDNIDRNDKRAFGKKRLFGEEEYRLKGENCSFSKKARKEIKSKQENFTPSFRKKAKLLKSKFHNLTHFNRDSSQNLRSKNASLGGDKDLENLTEKPLNTRDTNASEALKKKRSLAQADDIKKGFEKFSRLQEREDDRYAENEDDHLEKLVEDLDKKAARIKEENKAYNKKKPFIPPSFPLKASEARDAPP